MLKEIFKCEQTNKLYRDLIFKVTEFRGFQNLYSDSFIVEFL